MKFDISGKEPIGSGWSADVYRYGNDKVLKVLKKNVPEGHIVDEFRKTAFVNKAGIPSARAFCLADTNDGRKAILMEYVEGRKLSELLQGPDAGKYIDMLAELLRDIHSISADRESCDDIKKFYLASIKKLRETGKLSAVLHYAIERILNTIPDSDHYIHGDLNPTNIILCKGELKLIDFSSSGFGDSIFDICGMYKTLGTGKLQRSFIIGYYGITDSRSIRKKDIIIRLMADINSYLFLLSNDPCSRLINKLRRSLYGCLLQYEFMKLTGI